MRTKWVHRFDTVIADKAVKDGVWRRRDGGFVIRARVRDPRTGKDREIRRILPDCTLDEALVRLSEERAKILAGHQPEPIARIRLRDYAQALLEKKIRTGQLRSAESRKRWRLVLRNHVNPRLGDLYLTELRRSDLLAYHEHLASLAAQGHYSPQTCEGLLKIVKVVVRSFAREHGLPDLAAGLPGFDLSLRRTYTREQPNSLRPPETEAFLAMVSHRYPDYLAIISLGFGLGLRPSSLRALHKVDVLFEDGGWLLNRRSHTQGQEIMERTKIGKDTEIPLSPELLSMLRKHLEGLPPGPMRDSPLLFPSPTGKLLDPQKLWLLFRRVQRALRMTKKITPRGMRRTSKDLLRLSGASQVVAMAINGHHTDRMHTHYSTVNEVEIRDALSRAVQLGGIRPHGRTGGETGGGTGAERSTTMHQRRERNYAAALAEDSGRFSSSHGMGSFARRLAGGVEVVAGGPWRRGCDASQEAGIVAADGTHGLLAGAVSFAEQTTADHRVSAGVRHRRQSSVRRR